MAHFLLASAPRACFARQEFREALVSYDVITPIAARGIFEAVHWTPAVRWRIQSIRVLNPVRTQWSTEEVSLGTDKSISKVAEGREALILLDVSYLIEARFDLTDSAGPRDSAAQHAAMFKRRARSGKLFRQPYFGRRAFPANISLADKTALPPSSYAGSGEIDLGWMAFDSQGDPLGRMHYYRPTMCDGVIDVAAIDAAALPV